MPPTNKLILANNKLTSCLLISAIPQYLLRHPRERGDPGAVTTEIGQSEAYGIQATETSQQSGTFAFTLDSRLRGNDDLVLLRISANQEPF